MSDDNPLQPEWGKLGISESDTAEPQDAGVDHFAEENPRQTVKGSGSLWDKLKGFFNPSKEG